MGLAASVLPCPLPACVCFPSLENALPSLTCSRIGSSLLWPQGSHLVPSLSVILWEVLCLFFSPPALSPRALPSGPLCLTCCIILLLFAFSLSLFQGEMLHAAGLRFLNAQPLSAQETLLLRCRHPGEQGFPRGTCPGGHPTQRSPPRLPTLSPRVRASASHTGHGVVSARAEFQGCWGCQASQCAEPVTCQQLLDAVRLYVAVTVSPWMIPRSAMLGASHWPACHARWVLEHPDCGPPPG